MIRKRSLGPVYMYIAPSPSRSGTVMPVNAAPKKASNSGLRLSFFSAQIKPTIPSHPPGSRTENMIAVIVVATGLTTLISQTCAAICPLIMIMKKLPKSHIKKI